MTELHVVRVFVGTGDLGGNELGVFLDGKVIPVERRLALTAELGFSETVYVDDLETARIALMRDDWMLVPAALRIARGKSSEPAIELLG